MKFRLTMIASAIALIASGPVFAGGAGGCSHYNSSKYTSAEPQEQSEASKKLATLSAPASDQEAADQAAPEKATAEGAQTAEKTTQ